METESASLKERTERWMMIDLEIPFGGIACFVWRVLGPWSFLADLIIASSLPNGYIQCQPAICYESLLTQSFHDKEPALYMGLSS